MIYETNCLLVDGEDRKRITDLVGETWWNDNEDIYCIPTDCLESSLLEQMEVIFPNIGKAQFIIIQGTL